MGEKTTIIHITELLAGKQKKDYQQTKICCFLLDAGSISGPEDMFVFVNAVFTVLVLSGTATIRVNYKDYDLSAGSLVMLSSAHLFRFVACDEDFKAHCLFVSQDFMDAMDPAEMIYMRTKCNVQLYNMPVFRLHSQQQDLLSARLAAVQAQIDNIGHLYRKHMILSMIIAYFLDISDMVEKNVKPQVGKLPTRYEILTKRFVDLLMNCYRKEHLVDFYATRLNISTHYLSRIVKRMTGHSASDLIFEMIYGEARALLAQSELSIQQISDKLCFSDQSAFGKFFKRRSGLSPKRYRNRS